MRTVDVDHLIERLKRLQAHLDNGGFFNHAHGMRKAIELIKRELASKGKPTEF